MVCPGEIFIDKYTDKFGCFFFAVISNTIWGIYTEYDIQPNEHQMTFIWPFNATQGQMSWCKLIELCLLYFSWVSNGMLTIIVGILVKISESCHGFYASYVQQQLICTQI